jgi:general secretion pathway protein F
MTVPGVRDMPSFHYRAYDAQGTLALGRIDAATSDAASEALWSQGLTAFQLKDLGNNGTRWWQREVLDGGARRARLTAFTREFATLASAGIPLDECLRILSDQATSRALQTLARDIRQDVLNGRTLSEALKTRSNVFPQDYVTIVKAGEAAGAVGNVFEELAALLERRQEVRAKIQSALVYPAILLVLSAVSLSVIIGVLIPSIAPVFAQGGRPLPATIRILLVAQERWPEICFGIATLIAAVAWLALAAARRPALRTRIDRMWLGIPVAGKLALEQETARFARTLGTLLRAGVPLLQASQSAHAATSNRHIAAGVEDAIAKVREGASLSRALSETTCLPSVALRMMAIGEEAGKLDHMLLKIAAIFEQGTQRRVDRLMTLLTPVITAAIAVLVGSLILTVMNAILSINDMAVR